MDTKFAVIFFISTLILEIIPIKKFMEKTRTYRMTDFSDVDDKVIAEQIKSGSYYDDEKRQYISWARYQWDYNGKKHKTTLQRDGNDTFPYELELTVNRKTGKAKTPEAERRIDRMTVSLIIGAAVLGYIIASIICGYSPLLS